MLAEARDIQQRAKHELRRPPQIDDASKRDEFTPADPLGWELVPGFFIPSTKRVKEAM